MKLTATDFDQLTINSTNWAATHKAWKKQEGRFEAVGDFNQDIDYTFIRAYWLEDYASVLFAKAFLEALNYEYKVLFDSADSLYVITTNYGGELK
jgi:hypothetical protein